MLVVKFQGHPEFSEAWLTLRHHLSRALRVFAPLGLHISVLLSFLICADVPSLPLPQFPSYFLHLRSAWSKSLKPLPKSQVEIPSLLPCNSQYVLAQPRVGGLMSPGCSKLQINLMKGAHEVRHSFMVGTYFILIQNLWPTVTLKSSQGSSGKVR